MNHAIVLDWDGVIFDDDKYRLAFTSELGQFVSTYEIEALYQSSKDRNGFNDQRLSRAVAEAADVSFNDVQQRMDDVMSRTKDEFLFADASDFINRYNTDPLIVLTAGDIRIQSAKIEASRLTSRFTQIIIVSAEHTEQAKKEALQNLLHSYSSMSFYDDKLSTVQHLAREFTPSVLQPVFVNRVGATVPTATISITSLSEL